MFKLIVIAVVVFIVWKKLSPKNKAMVKSVRVDVPAVKEAGRGVIVRLLVGMISILTGLLGMVLGNQKSNLPTIRR